MCTLTYLPDPEGKSYILTSNRDERMAREIALLPVPLMVQGIEVLAPIDARAKGSWIGTSGLGHSVCLLNGAFEAHIPQPSYRHSRGLIVLQALAAKEGEVLFDELELSDIEPFTLVYVASNPLRLLELRWDGQQKHVREFDPLQPRIWSSCTLYTSAMQAEREAWFARWLKDRLAFYPDDIINFHCTEGREQPEMALLMKRGKLVQTVSTTCIIYTATQVEMRYIDHAHTKSSQSSLKRDWPVRQQTAAL